MKNDPNYLYRAFGQVETDRHSGSFKPSAPKVTVMVDAITILRRTPAGAWIISPTTGKEVWVSTLGRKRFACPTREDALESLVQRNKWRLVHLGNAIAKAEAIREAFKGVAPVEIENLIDGCYKE